MYWKLFIFLAIICISTGIYMDYQVKKWKKDNDIPRANKYQTYRNIFYGLGIAFTLCMALSFILGYKKVKKYHSRYSYKMINNPDEEDVVTYSTQEEEEQEYPVYSYDVHPDAEEQWITAFKNLKGNKASGKYLLNEFNRIYGPGPGNAERILSAYIENSECASKKNFVRDLFEKRNNCFDSKNILESVNDYALAHQKGNRDQSEKIIRELPCDQVSELNRNLGMDIRTHCSDIIAEQKDKNVLPSGATPVVRRAERPFDETREVAIGVFAPQRRRK